MKSQRLFAKLERLMDARGITQRELSAMIGQHANRVHSWVTKQVGEPSAWEGLKLARVFDVPFEWLADEEDDRLDPPEVPPSPLTADQREILDAWVLAGITRQEAVARLYTLRVRHERPHAPERIRTPPELAAEKQDVARERAKKPPRRRRQGHKPA